MKQYIDRSSMQAVYLGSEQAGGSLQLQNCNKEPSDVLGLQICYSFEHNSENFIMPDVFSKNNVHKRAVYLVEQESKYTARVEYSL